MSVARRNKILPVGSIGEAMFTNSMDAILLTSPDGRVFAANPAACRLFLMDENEIIRRGRENLVDSDDPRLEPPLKLRLKNRSAKGVLTCKRGDGTTFQGEISSGIFNEQESANTIMIIRDVTSRMIVDEELNFRSEIISNMTEGIQLTRYSDHSIIYANPQFEKMFGYEPGELLGKDVSVLNAPTFSDPREVADEIFQLLKMNGSYNGEILNIRKNGEPFWCSVNVSEYHHSKHGTVWISIHQNIEGRKKVESELRESEQRYRNLVEMSPIGISIYQDGRFVFINRAGMKMIGARDPGDIIGKPVMSIIHPDSKNILVRRMVDAAHGSSLQPAEEKLIRLNGEVFDAQVMAIATTYNNRPAGQVIVTDITERKQLEKNLRENLRFLNETQSKGNIGSWDWDLKTGKAYWSDQLFFIYGRDPKLGVPDITNYIERYHPDDRKPLQEAIRNAIDSDQSYIIDYRIYRENDGIERWIRSQGQTQKDENGEVCRLLGVAQDITERKAVEEKLRKANTYNRKLLEVNIDPLVTIGRDGKILDVNKATQEATGYSREELIGTDFSDYFTDEVRARKGYKMVFSAGFVKDYPLRLKSRNGKTIPVLYNATVFMDEEGQVAGVFAAARDITELLKIQNKLKRSSHELRKLTRHLVEIREEERRQIASELHDDLGQKLTALNLSLSWMRSRIGVQSQDVERMLLGMTHMINDTIGSIKKLSFGLRPSILDDLGIQAAIEWLLSEFRNSSSVKTELYFSPDDIKLNRFISLGLFRIVQEALTNIVRHAHATEISVSLSVKSRIRLEIKDNGIGIRSFAKSGSGSFGIRGMEERARTLGGMMKITGLKGKGTTITVVLPIKSSTEK